MNNQHVLVSFFLAISIITSAKVGVFYVASVDLSVC